MYVLQIMPELHWSQIHLLNIKFVFMKVCNIYDTLLALRDKPEDLDGLTQ